ncbi:hypothetical protein RA2_04537 [Roseovarius sp. A-2]|nr:hypothetical protein RA2_04537 [Roseovarius sp. A-2]
MCNMRYAPATPCQKIFRIGYQGQDYNRYAPGRDLRGIVSLILRRREVKVDGAAFGGHVRPANLRERRIARQRLGNRSGKRRVVVVLRQRGGRTLMRAFLR